MAYLILFCDRSTNNVYFSKNGFLIALIEITFNRKARTHTHTHSLFAYAFLKVILGKSVLGDSAFKSTYVFLL